MKVSSPRKNTAGFTLIEMIGVLAIIAILTALLIPKVFAVLNDSKITNALGSYNTAKAAASANYGKWGKFSNADGTKLAFSDTKKVIEDWDDQLVKGDYLEKRFGVKIGNGLVGTLATDGSTAQKGSRLRVIDISGLDPTEDTVAADDTGTYDIGGKSKIDTTGSFLVEAVIPEVAIQDAIELNNRIDSELTALTADSRSDLTGRVKWKFTTGPTVDVYMYVAHR